MNVLLFNNRQLAKLTDWDGSMFIRNEMEYENTLRMERKGTPGFCANEVSLFFHIFYFALIANRMLFFLALLKLCWNEIIRDPHMGKFFL